MAHAIGDLDAQSLQHLFARKEVKCRGDGGSAGATTHRVVEVLDAKRANEVGISLAHMKKLPREGILQALRWCSPERLGGDRATQMDMLQSLVRCVPTAEEKKELAPYAVGGPARKHMGAEQQLAPADEFLLALLEVQGDLALRLHCMLLMLNGPRLHRRVA